MFFIKALNDIHALYGNYVVVAVMTLFLVIATITDIKALKIPDKLNIAFLISRFLLIPIMGFSLSSIEGALLGFFVLMIPAMIKMHKMGGDIKNMTVLGLFAGIYVTPLIIVLSCVYGLIYGIGKIAITKKGGLMPFAPFFLASHITLFIIAILVH